MNATLLGAGPLPTQPLIAAAVLRELTNAGPELTALVEIDPSLTASVMAAANAPHLRQARRIASVRQAMVLLGTTAVEAIATSRTAALVMGPDDVGCPPRFWVRSVAAAAACAVLADRLGTNVDEAFTAGMLHDVGDLILFRSDPELHGVVATRMQKGGRTVTEQEKVLFGRNHADVGADQFDRWFLPDRIVRAIRWHHGQPEALTDPLARIVWAGFRLGSHVSDNPLPVGANEVSRPAAVLGAIGLSRENPDAVLADIDRHVNRIVALAGREH